MNGELLKSQFERLVREPGDARLLKQLAVELGSIVARGEPEAVREYRVHAAAALRALEDRGTGLVNTYAMVALSSLLDVAACAEETQTARIERAANDAAREERDRCAKIAEGYSDGYEAVRAAEGQAWCPKCTEYTKDVAYDIAAAIRDKDRK